MPRPNPPAPTPEQATERGRLSGETRRRKSAKELAAAAAADAVRELLLNPPPLTAEQRDRLRVLLNGESGQ